jgi:Arc/MetJ family transcription regulator
LAFLSASFDAIYDVLDEGCTERTTIAFNDKFPAKAQAFTGLQEKSALVREALRVLIERDSARPLARLGGTEPDLKPIPRRQADA